jgi:1,4-dihydroxy-6-naphthoate synthase
MTKRLTLGFSPCPNDTFMFHDLVHGGAPVDGVAFAAELLDIEELNRGALLDPPRFDVTKLSLPAFARARQHYELLGSGAALGRGCGPLVVRRADRDDLGALADLAGRRVAIPGAHTTAYRLLRRYGPTDQEAIEMRFDAIMPAVARGEVDAGLIIHESRFTYRIDQLVQLADLGESWEADTGLPLPLGVIVARRSLGDPCIRAVEAGLRRSIENAFADPERSRGWIRAHAQEMDEQVCRRHIELYVNDYSLDLGDEGRAAVERLLAIEV